MGLPVEVVEFAVGGRARRAAVWLPQGYDPGRRWPLLVFLHGYGERGDAFEHLPHGLPRVLAAHPERFPCVVLMPQCPTDLVWVVVDEPWAVGHGSAEPHLDAAIGTALSRYPIDPGRMALTGLSMGGFGTFVYGARNVERFRVLAAVCGGGREQDAEQLARVPIWVLHGAADDVVPVDKSRRMVDAITAAGGNVRYTEFPGVGHVSWDLAYADPQLAAFLMGPLAGGRPALPGRPDAGR